MDCLIIIPFSNSYLFIVGGDVVLFRREGKEGAIFSSLTGHVLLRDSQFQRKIKEHYEEYPHVTSQLCLNW